MIEPASTITCPACGHQATEVMPTDYCQFFYDCTGCGAQLKPKHGDCCVYCSYGSVPCPPMQKQQSEIASTHCCGSASQSDKSARLSCRKNDWAGDWRSLALLWGVPAAAMVAGGLLEPVARGAVWAVALIWMGTACLSNARRCSRTHCRFTGPFYLLMAPLVVMLALGALPLGEHGWQILGAVTVLGTALLWWGTERIWGTFSR